MARTRLLIGLVAALLVLSAQAGSLPEKVVYTGLPPMPRKLARDGGLYSAHRDLLQTSAAILDKFKLGVVCTSGIHPNGTKVTAASKSPCTGNEVCEYWAAPAGFVPPTGYTGTARAQFCVCKPGKCLCQQGNQRQCIDDGATCNAGFADAINQRLGRACCRKGFAHCDADESNCESLQLNDRCGTCTTNCNTATTGRICTDMLCQCPADKPYFCDGRCRACCLNTHCPLPHMMCETGQGASYTCTCAGDWRNCNGLPADGCELDTSGDPKNCGSCGKQCPAGTPCTDAVCGGVGGGACLTGWTYCNGACQQDNTADRGGTCCATKTCKSGFGLVCDGAAGSPGMCRCDTGFHWDGATCVKDDTVPPDTPCLFDISCAGNLICNNGGNTETQGQCKCPAGTTLCGDTCVPNHSLSEGATCCDTSATNINCNADAGLACKVDGTGAKKCLCGEGTQWCLVTLKCIPTSGVARGAECCGDTDCAANTGMTCGGEAPKKCGCPAGTTWCTDTSTCIATSGVTRGNACCITGNCADGTDMTCSGEQAYKCGCPTGKTWCSTTNTCILDSSLLDTATCCATTNCNATLGLSCVSGQCACAADHTWCGGTCVPDNTISYGSQCCADASCAAATGVTCTETANAPGQCLCDTGYTRCNNACVPDGSIALGSQCCADASCAAGIGLTCLGETALTAGQCGCETGRANCDANTANGCEITLATGVVVGDKIQNCGSCGSLALNTTTMTCTNGQPTCKDPKAFQCGDGTCSECCTETTAPAQSTECLSYYGVTTTKTQCTSRTCVVPPVIQTGACQSDSQCPEGLICNLNSLNGPINACICPTGTVKCNNACIDPLQQCCNYDSTIGLPCPGAVGSNPAQICSSATFTCVCPSGTVQCGATCIDPKTQCCTANLSLGKLCGTDNPICLGDGQSCVQSCPGANPTEIAANTCGSSCLTDPTKQCCADASKSLIGEKFGDNGGCLAKPFCVLKYQYRPGLYGTIVGRYCPNSAEPNVCKECCESKDCPNVGTGQVCNAGFCSSNGCTTFKCWEIQGNTNNVCKTDGSSCVSCNSQGATRCAAGLCCDNGKSSCMNTCVDAKGALQPCCQLSCKTNGALDGRTCGTGCGVQGNPWANNDPLFRYTSYADYSTYVYPVCVALPSPPPPPPSPPSPRPPSPPSTCATITGCASYSATCACSTCAAPFVSNGSGGCSCPSPYTLTGSACQCPAITNCGVQSPTTCACTTCAAPFVSNGSGGCQCPAIANCSVQSPATCACTTCAAPFVSNGSGGCQCPAITGCATYSATCTCSTCSSPLFTAGTTAGTCECATLANCSAQSSTTCACTTCTSPYTVSAAGTCECNTVVGCATYGTVTTGQTTTNCVCTACQAGYKQNNSGTYNTCTITGGR